MDRRGFLKSMPAALGAAVIGAGGNVVLAIQDGMLLDANAGSQARVYFCGGDVSFRAVRAYAPLEPGVIGQGWVEMLPLDSFGAPIIMMSGEGGVATICRTGPVSWAPIEQEEV